MSPLRLAVERSREVTDISLSEPPAHYIDPAPFLVRSMIVKTPLRQHAVKPTF